MGTELSSDSVMKRLLTAAVGAVAFALFVPSVVSQTPGRAPSVRAGAPTRSFRSGNGPRIVTRFGPAGGFRSPTPCCGTFSGGFTFGVGTPNNPFFPPTYGGHHHGFNSNFGGWGGVPYAVYPYYGYPYGYDTTYQDSQDSQSADDAQQEPPAPTIFERRAPRAPAAAPAAPADSYADNQDTTPVITANDVAAAQASAAEPTSVLIFRDGHQLEVQNYAIVGDTLYDLTPGHPRKIALASVDIAATVQANDDRGVTFRVPLAN